MSKRKKPTTNEALAAYLERCPHMREAVAVMNDAERAALLDAITPKENGEDSAAE